MKEIFQEYGGILVTVVAILAVLVVISAVIGDSEASTVGKAFSSLIDTFVKQANGKVL